jgi:hypothetical protein
MTFGVEKRSDRGHPRAPGRPLQSGSDLSRAEHSARQHLGQNGLSAVEPDPREVNDCAGRGDHSESTHVPEVSPIESFSEVNADPSAGALRSPGDRDLDILGRSHTPSGPDRGRRSVADVRVLAVRKEGGLLDCERYERLVADQINTSMKGVKELALHQAVD